MENNDVRKDLKRIVEKFNPYKMHLMCNNSKEMADALMAECFAEGAISMAEYYRSLENENNLTEKLVRKV